MKIDEAFQVTRVRTGTLCAQLDCDTAPDTLDDALADAGYLRLDLGSAPGPIVEITPVEDGWGKDPGHRASAARMALALSHVIHAEYQPSPRRMQTMIEAVLGAVNTDFLGEHLVMVIAAYTAQNDPGLRLLESGSMYDPAPTDQARIAYNTIRIGSIVSDVALERVIAVGGNINGWHSLIEGNMRVDEPVVRMKRHDAADYEVLGVDPQLAEIISWIRANPDIDVPQFELYAKFIGIDARTAGLGIRKIMAERPQLIESGGPSSTMKSSSSGFSGPARSANSSADGEE